MSRRTARPDRDSRPSTMRHDLVVTADTERLGVRVAHTVRPFRDSRPAARILHRNLCPVSPRAHMFSNAGRYWLSRQPLPMDERVTVEALLRQLDFHDTNSSWSSGSSPATPSTTRSWLGSWATRRDYGLLVAWLVLSGRGCGSTRRRASSRVVALSASWSQSIRPDVWAGEGPHDLAGATCVDPSRHPLGEAVPVLQPRSSPRA
jgi:hypothetical protein